MKPDTMTIIAVGMSGLILFAAALEVRDANMLAENYRVSAHRALSMAESCATRSDDWIYWERLINAKE